MPLIRIKMIKNRIVLFGSMGQVGKALLALLTSQHSSTAEIITPSIQDADFSLPHTLEPVLIQSNPTLVINAAAYTQVDQAEHEKLLATSINGESPGVISRWCAEQDIPLIHYSTDYVYSGESSIPWTEDTPLYPLSVYGRSKAMGDQKIIESGGKYLIFRTSWVYDATGQNFVKTMLRLGQEREILSIVADQRGAPTYAKHLAAGTWAALKTALHASQFPSGVYHCCNAGETGWNEFAEMIFSEAQSRNYPLLKIKKIQPLLTSEYPTPARRPLNSRLNTHKLKTILGVTLPDWQIGLRECMQEIFP